MFKNGYEKDMPCIFNLSTSPLPNGGPTITFGEEKSYLSANTTLGFHCIKGDNATDTNYN
jgi:hypothetical protein